MRRRLHSWFIALSFVLGATGCFRSTAHSGLPPGKPSPRVDEVWHHSLFWGLVDLSGSYDLVQACPEGWAEVHSEVGVAHGALAFLTLGVYYSESVSVICAAKDDSLPQITKPGD